MFERLFDLFLHAKTGVIAGVFLIGTTGALVTATVQNGVTTITVTPEVSASPSASATASATASPTASPSSSSFISSSTTALQAGTTSTQPCSDAAHAMADAVKEVDSAFSKDHTDLEHLRKDEDVKGPQDEAARKIIEKADKLLKDIRKNAVKAIHEQGKCEKVHDDQGDDGPDADNDGGPKAERHNDNFIVAFITNLFGHKDTTFTLTTNASPAPSASTTPNTTTIVIGGTDVKTIADNAVAAMKTVFDTAVSDIQALPSPSPKPTKRPETAPRADNRPAGTDDHGRNGNGKGGSDRH